MKNRLPLIMVMFILIQSLFSQNPLSINEHILDETPLFNMEKRFFFNINLGYAKYRGVYNEDGKVEKSTQNREYLTLPLFFETKIIEQVFVSVNTDGIYVLSDKNDPFYDELSLNNTWLNLRYYTLGSENSSTLRLSYKLKSSVDNQYGYDFGYSYSVFRENSLYTLNISSTNYKYTNEEDHTGTNRAFHFYFHAGSMQKNGLCIAPFIGGYTASLNISDSNGSKYYTGIRLLKYSNGRFVSKIAIIYDFKGKNQPAGFGIELNIF